MCDTMVALRNSTKNGQVLFAKNSDREPNEAHEVVIIPRAKHAAGEMLKCTYIEIPQVQETYRVLLAKPFWIWGAEMGSNEYSVTIGNEAVFTRDPYGKEPGLIGMDFLRLALERSKTAHEALITIIELLEKYGQSGNCGFAHPMFYHNSFLICDPDEAWILETSAREWAAKKVKDIGSISNAITIENDYDMASANLVNHAVEKGWCKDPTKFNFSQDYSEPVYTLFSDARRRQACTLEQLKSAKRKIDPFTMMAVLRNHKDDINPNWSPDKGVSGADVCMHSAWGPIRGSQSVGSMVSQLDRSDTVHWLTGTSAPCTSLFKPVWIDCGIPESGPSPKGKFDYQSLYWKHERIHRRILQDYTGFIPSIKKSQQEFETEMVKEVSQNLSSSVNHRTELSQKYFSRAQNLEEDWLHSIADQKISHKNRWLYKIAWNKFNKEAEIIIN